MASFITDAAQLAIQNGTIVVGDTFRFRLVASSVTPTRASTTMTGMTAIGTNQAATTVTQTLDSTNHRVNWGADNPLWTSVASGSTIGWVVFYKFVTNDAGSTPVFVIDVNDTATDGNNIGYTVPATGVGYSQG